MGGDERYPINRVFCVGRNYAAHAAEMGGDPNRVEPFFFQKHPTCVSRPEQDFPYPSISNDVHHEIEQVIAIGQGGQNIKLEDAMDHVFGFAVGVDMTLRDVQAKAKEGGKPWDVAKGFDHSAPISAIRPIDAVEDWTKGAISLSINGELKQSGDINQMVWKVPEIISYLSGLFALNAGDLIMTGTPAGVGPVVKGDKVTGTLEHVGTISFQVV